MLKLSLTIACFICFLVFLHAETEKEQGIKKLDSEKIIAIFKHGDYKEKLEAYKLLDNKWGNETLQKSSTKELDKLFKFCFVSVKNFPWDKYIPFTPENPRHLSKVESQKVNGAGLMMGILAIGAILNNPEAVNVTSYLEEKSKTSLVGKKQYIMWNRSLHDLKRRQNSKEAQKLISSGYTNCRKKLMDTVTNKNYTKNQLSVFFLTGISNNSVFLAEFKKDKQAKEQLLINIKKQFPTIKGKLIKDRAIRTAFVNLFYRLESPKDAIEWLETIIKMPNVSAQEKQSIQQNRINDLKRSLDIPIDKKD